MKPAHCNQRTLCLWLPQWPLQRAHSDRPELRGRELVLYEEHRRGCFRVVACSGKFGITRGMPLVEAAALGPVQCEPHDPLADEAALKKLAGWCEQFSPIVGIEGTDNLCLDVTGLGPLFGGEEAIVQQVARAFGRLGLQTRMALADTLGAAWAVAHFGAEGAVVVPPARAIEALAPLPIAALRLPNQSVELLTELGIRQIDGLLALPRGALAARFGAELLKRLDQATGQLAEAIPSYRPPPEIVAEISLEYPTAERQTIERLLAQLMERIVRALDQRRQGAIQLECRFRCEGHEPIGILLGLFQANAQQKHLLELLHARLERTVLPGPVAEARLAVAAAAPLACRQQELFDDRSGQEGQRELGLLVDRLSSRLGREAVARAVLLPDAQPEFAFRHEPLVGVLSHRKKQPGQKQKPRPKLLPRPLRLEIAPLPLAVEMKRGSKAPLQFYWQGAWHRVARAWGPERIQTGWWRGRYVQRDYFRVETTRSARFWLFRRLPKAEWFLHGMFD